MSPTGHSLTGRLVAAEAVLLVIDVQEKLVPLIADAAGMLAQTTFLIQAARCLDVPITATEQYPRGLGATVPSLASLLPTERPEKFAFSCAGVPGLTDAWRAQNRHGVVLAGIETHVCVLQTALDLLADNWRVHIPVDAVSARGRFDHDIALRRLERAGAVLTTAEATVFEWTGGADHPRFKDVSRLVKQRGTAHE